MNLSLYDPECEGLVADLLAYMSPAEKVGQLSSSPLVTTGDLDGMDLLVEAIRKGEVGVVHGVRNREQADYLQKLARDESRLGIPLLFPGETGSGFATRMPAPLTMAASWDADAVEAAFAVVAQEAAGSGINWLSLTEEGAATSSCSPGEDVRLASAIAAARLRGLQRPFDRSGVRSLAHLDLSALGAAAAANRSRFMQFACCTITFGQPASVRLASGNDPDLNAPPALSAPGGFDGIFVSQWQELARQTGVEATGEALPRLSFHALLEALEDGRVDRALVDDAVSRVLRAKFRHGLLRAAFSSPDAAQAPTLPTPIHNREMALALARRCPILLRNDPPVLPLGIDSGDVLVIGQVANDRHLPIVDGHGVAASVVDGLEQLGIPHRFVPGLALREGKDRAGPPVAADGMAVGMAMEAARRAGTVILVVASDEQGRFGEAEQELIAAVSSANANLVLVNLGPVPVDPWVGGKPLPGVLHAGQLGTMSGHAIAELLAGEHAPCGRLPIAIGASNRGAGLPLGHGLSYSECHLSELSVEYARDAVHLTVRVHNTGEWEATETVQVFLGRSEETREGADKGADREFALACFQRIALPQGRFETLRFELGRNELGYYTDEGSFHISQGALDVHVGLSSRSGLAARLEISPAFAQAIASSGLHPTGPGMARYRPGQAG